MPYNSSSFEKQLARYKAAQAAASVEKMPDDPHRVRARVSTSERGKLQPNTIGVSQLVGDGPQTTPVLRGDQKVDPNMGNQTIIIVQGKKKKPLLLRGWFIFLATTILSTAAIPVFYKEEMKEMMGLLDTVKSTTGVDPLSVTTYKNMIKGKAHESTEPPVAPVAIPADTPEPTMNVHSVVEKAQQKADDVTSRGAGASMKYIEEETKRLNDMAKQLDQQYSGKK